MLLALILKSKEARLARKQKGGPTATLVVAKLSLLPQWEDELRSKTNLSHRIFYGQGKPPSVEELEGVVSSMFGGLPPPYGTMCPSLVSNFYRFLQH